MDKFFFFILQSPSHCSVCICTHICNHAGLCIYMCVSIYMYSDIYENIYKHTYVSIPMSNSILSEVTTLPSLKFSSLLSSSAIYTCSFFTYLLMLLICFISLCVYMHIYIYTHTHILQRHNGNF